MFHSVMKTNTPTDRNKQASSTAFQSAMKQIRAGHEKSSIKEKSNMVFVDSKFLEKDRKKFEERVHDRIHALVTNPECKVPQK